MSGDNYQTKEELDVKQIYFKQIDRSEQKAIDEAFTNGTSATEIETGINFLWYTIPTSWKKGKYKRRWTMIEKIQPQSNFKDTESYNKGKERVFKKIQLIVDLLEHEKMWRKRMEIDVFKGV